MTKLRGNDGFTLVELMVVILVISVLLSIAVPTFLSTRARAQDTAAKETLVTAEKVARQVALEQGRFPTNAFLLAQLPLLESSLVWVDHTVSATSPPLVSIDEDNGGTELNMAVGSGSGACFYLRVLLNDRSSRQVDPVASDCEAHDYLGGPDTGW